ncbi:hypothetical protein B0T26DRAFT_746158 [Lasiosphaeria miniovina]|uniref:Abscission/NoCut checkpoint regulator n=1 Tax=Lasiosphaeria miniovina TaxID=1954250 RepID=A0AA40BH95_9PEZI|nr:uncharacterized protein B0T26DRAFT_746158 [Lasiosphaeria miniovina]KAK0734217.1 hypothetical protein B0T26DRAFT_746158 [Lasiosphaeria miniovina]
MASSRPSDKSLLERLNALKPTKITLDKAVPNSSLSDVPASAAARHNLGPTSEVAHGQPVLTREDALAARLRLLRSRVPGSPLDSPRTGASGASRTQPPPESSRKSAPSQTGSGRGSKKLELLSNPVSVPTETNPPATAALTTSPLEAYEDPYSFDQEEVDELLEGLTFDLGDDAHQEIEFECASDSSGSGSQEAQGPKSKLNKLSSDLPEPSHKGSSGKAARKASSPRRLFSGVHSDSDDSEGEHMAKEVEAILARIRDEIGPDLQEPDGPDNTAPKEASDAGQDKAGSKSRYFTGPIPDDVSNDLDGSGDESGGGGGGDILALPTVPSALPDDPPPAAPGKTAQRKKSLDFEKDIAARMASLCGLGSSSPARGAASAVGDDDASGGLPSVPTFRPGDRLSKKGAAAKAKGAGYTDEDQKKWCIVCLDDATITCSGCDDDVYCGRC